jgi:hypothetical protein
VTEAIGEAAGEDGLVPEANHGTWPRPYWNGLQPHGHLDAAEIVRGGRMLGGFDLKRVGL